MAVIENGSKRMQASIENAIEGILGKIADKRYSNVVLEHTRGTQSSITLRTIPSSYVATFHPAQGEGTIFNDVAFGLSMWTVRHIESGERARKITVEELTHSVIISTNRAVGLNIIVNAHLTIKQLAKLIVLSLTTKKSSQQLLQEAKRSPAR